MDRLQKPIDPAILEDMLRKPEFSGKSAAELRYLIKCGLDIMTDQEQFFKGKKVRDAHYHLPLNHVEAKRAAEMYLKLSPASG